MFDDALLESRSGRTPNGKRLSFPLAIGLHAAVIGAFVGASAWFTGEAPEPVIPVLFPPSSSSGPPPPLGGAQAGHTPGTVKTTKIHRTLATFPAKIALPAPEQQMVVEDPDSPSEPGDGRHGTRNGVADGTGDEENSALTTPPDPEKIYWSGGDVTAPVLVQRIEPDYPESARRAHLQGTVVLEAIITASGVIEEIRVVKSVNPLLDESAQRAVRQWRYKAATLNGRAVRVYLTVTIRYGLDG